MLSKVRKFAITLLIFMLSVSLLQINYAKSAEDEDWEVIITSDTKEFNDTHEIKFEVEENPNVVKGVMAPGSKAHATFNIDLSKADGLVEFMADIDDSNNNIFEISAKINDNPYNLGEMVLLEKDVLNPVYTFTIELEWSQMDSSINTLIGTSVDSISFPIIINASQHI